MDLKSMSVRDLARNPERAREALGNYLRQGSLALVLGAGVSKPLGLPEWWQLVQRCAKAASLSDLVDSSTDPETLMKVVEKVEAKFSSQPAKYRDIVRECLYQGVPYTQSSIQEYMLIALGALLMGSKRGSVGEVLTTNFDDLLEWFLEVHGFAVRAVTDLPVLKTNADVTIYHPNGFLPQDPSRRPLSDFLVFSEYSFQERIGDQLNPWTQVLRDLILSRFVLFVGISGKDQTISNVVVDVGSKIERHRYSGAWLFGEPLDDTKIDWWQRRNILPLCFNNNDEIPAFLLGVCQSAAAAL